MSPTSDIEVIEGPAPGEDSSVPPEPDAPPLRRIVVAYDDSDGATAAARFALWLAGHAATEVILAHTCPWAEEADGFQEALPGRAEQVIAYQREWQLRLNGIRSYALPGANVGTALLRGHPGLEIARHALRLGADAVFAGLHDPRPIGKRTLGSTVRDLLRDAPCPVMLFPATTAPARNPRTVIVGVAGARAADDGPEAARSLGSAIDADVLEVPLAQGRSRERFVDACERHAPAVAVIGTVAGHRLDRRAQWLLAHAPCPVLVVP